MSSLTKTREYSKSFTTPFWLLLLLFLVNGYVHASVVSEHPLVHVLFHALSGEQHTPKHTSTFYDEYDFIVVGSGAGGGVVASRLSEVSCVNVLLLEAGGDPPLVTDIPAMTLLSMFTHVDWKFKTVPQKHAGFSLTNRQIPFPTGKMIGGTSSMNQMLYVRGNRLDYDGWAAEGAEGWGYDDVLPYFLKLEGNTDPVLAKSVYHNTSGPVTFETPKFNPPLKSYFREAIEELGYKIRDPNAEKQTGFYDVQGNTRNGRRCATPKAYLVPAEKRPNLNIVSNAMVTKILISGNTAVGVQFDYKDKTYRVRATREVIVSAGGVGTAQLLMLSGVGPKEELEKFKIPVLADLPVGKNFHDQASFLMLYEMAPYMEPIYTKLLNPVNLIEYMTEGSGVFSALAFTLYMAFLRSNLRDPDIDDPNYQLYLNEVSMADAMIKVNNVRPEVYEAYYRPYDFKPLIMCLVTQVQPWSRGTITLNSTNIYDPPLIDPNYLADPRDVRDMVQGMKSCQRLMKTKAMQGTGAKPFTTVVPGCEKHLDNENCYLKCMVKHLTSSAHHIGGSAKMGDPDDPTTVVDPKLRVKGIQGLRVVDGSVMPTVMSGNTNTPIMMIGEKASDMIKETITCERRNRRRRIISPPEETLAEEIEKAAEQPFKDSIDILEAMFEEVFKSHENKDDVIERLKNPMDSLDSKSKDKLKNKVGEISDSLPKRITNDLQDLFTVF